MEQKNRKRSETKRKVNFSTNKNSESDKKCRKMEEKTENRKSYPQSAYLIYEDNFQAAL